MKLLLDENLPLQLKEDFREHQVFTVRDQGWLGKENGELLNEMLLNGFDVLITADKNLKNQQNLNKYPISILILSSNRVTYFNLQSLIPKIKEILNKPLQPGVVIIT